jgi:UTP--glucose-1-phosphate uridylyltransferase
MRVVIPAAGRGTRFRPMTRAMPKEMLPVVHKPVIEYVVESAVEAGAEDILIITGKAKRAIEDHFDGYGGHVRISYIRQPEPLGLGNALLYATGFTQDQPFAVLLGDTIYRCETPVLKQLLETYESRHADAAVAVETVPTEKVKDYGIVLSSWQDAMHVESLLEKPSPTQTTSRLALTGAYVLSPKVYSALARTAPGKNGEVQLTDALNLMAQEGVVYATLVHGERFDIGDPVSWLRANITFARRDPALREQLKEEVKQWHES